MPKDQGLEFAWQVDGRMHACGQADSAMVRGVALPAAAACEFLRDHGRWPRLHAESSGCLRA